MLSGSNNGLPLEFLCSGVSINNFSVGELVDSLKSVYCDTIGYDYMHIGSRQVNYLRFQLVFGYQPSNEFTL